MALLHHRRTDTFYCLGERNLFGRSEACTIQMDHRSISAEHASIVFKDGQCILRDLGSRNGTRVGETSLGPGQTRRLSPGDMITLGGEELCVVDVGPPGPIARQQDQTRTFDGSMLVVPSEEDPRLVVYGDGVGNWLAELDGEIVPVVDGDNPGDLGWTLHLPTRNSSGVATTWEMTMRPGLEQTALRLRVSQDEEHIEATVVLPDRHVELGPRVHHQLTLALARARKQDEQSEASTGEVGWLYIDEVCRMLRIGRPQFNQFIFRARRDLQTAGVEGAPLMFERRPHAGQIRLALREVEVLRF